MPDITSNLVGWWKADEGTGTTVADSSGNSNNGSFSGTPVWIGGHIGNALDCDGSGHVTVPDHSSLKPASAISFGGWFKTLSGNGYGICKEMLNGNTGYGCYNGANNFYLRVDTGGGETWIDVDAGATHDNEWEHRFATYDGTTFKTYINGAETASSAQAGTPVYDTEVLSLGGGLGNLRGSWDDLRIYSRALSADDVAALYAYTGVNTATASFTEPNETLSSSTLVAVAGVGSFTEPNETLTGTGAVTVIGSASFTEPNETLSSAAAVTWYAVAEFTEPNETLSSAAAVAVVGALNATDPAAETLSSAVAVAVVATAEFTEANETLSSDATVGSGITADAAFTEANETLSASAAVAVVADLAGTEANETLSGVASVAVVASAEFTEPNETLSSSVVGTLNAAAEFTEANETLSGAGVVLVDASMAATEDNETLSGAAAVAVAGSMTATEANETLSSTGLVVIIGTANFTEPGEQLNSLVDTGTGFVYGSQRRISIGVGVGL